MAQSGFFGSTRVFPVRILQNLEHRCINVLPAEESTQVPDPVRDFAAPPRSPTVAVAPGAEAGKM